MRADLSRPPPCSPASPTARPIALGRNLRFFGDGWQISQVIDGMRYWRIPVMDGEFVCEETTGVVKGVGGGNLLLLAARHRCRAGLPPKPRSRPCARLPNVIMPFPGGVVRSGSKVGSKYGAQRFHQRRVRADAGAAWSASELDRHPRACWRSSSTA